MTCLLRNDSSSQVMLEDIPSSSLRSPSSGRVSVFGMDAPSRPQRGLLLPSFMSGVRPGLGGCSVQTPVQKALGRATALGRDLPTEAQPKPTSAVRSLGHPPGQEQWIWPEFLSP